MNYTVLIPARFASTRFPGKPLADIHGKPMIQHVYERSKQAGASHVVVATDDVRIADVVEAFGGHFCMTRPDHESGTERLAEVVEALELDDDHIVVNVQGDEPFVPPEIIRQVAENLAASQAPMATLAVKIHDADEATNPNAVKVVVDSQGYALYFSRAIIPYDRNRFMHQDKISQIGDHYLRHIGIYGYRAGFIKAYVAMQPSVLEQVESLEQLRVLWHGEKIHVAVAAVAPPAGVDTPEDLQRLLKHKEPQ
ncbi:3-deoxy-manno-octulosonate cytidylyltransferase [Bowmanella sp. JS7-9]|uniref:3-deoxy-manno-octulosonate cytidylyltransferase n=1 Tax=Pseudobowmanella zhangzhouensis TaxID=1537679 RepID=A0ABW1XJC7_9ALTE|nr:3-deoxy-manno-octulosonate cytidylyltransferase [Bowmanella sp. JS7-9]TBX26079.1 3-deoxy-manno-octulosonate cytidylyltransferase [Bowmanella sp. JS7-9]